MFVMAKRTGFFVSNRAAVLAGVNPGVWTQALSLTTEKLFDPHPPCASWIRCEILRFAPRPEFSSHVTSREEMKQN